MDDQRPPNDYSIRSKQLVALEDIELRHTVNVHKLASMASRIVSDRWFRFPPVLLIECQRADRTFYRALDGHHRITYLREAGKRRVKAYVVPESHYADILQYWFDGIEPRRISPVRRHLLLPFGTANWINTAWKFFAGASTGVAIHIPVFVHGLDGFAQPTFNPPVFLGLGVRGEIMLSNGERAWVAHRPRETKARTTSRSRLEIPLRHKRGVSPKNVAFEVGFDLLTTTLYFAVQTPGLQLSLTSEGLTVPIARLTGRLFITSEDLASHYRRLASSIEGTSDGDEEPSSEDGGSAIVWQSLLEGDFEQPDLVQTHDDIGYRSARRMPDDDDDGDT